MTTAQFFAFMISRYLIETPVGSTPACLQSFQPEGVVNAVNSNHVMVKKGEV